MNTIPVELKTEQPHVYTGVYQHDYGQILQIHGKNLPAVAEVQFSLQDQGGQTETRVGVTTNDVLEVQVPDKMLKNEEVTENYCIFAYLYITDGKSGNTEYKITIHTTSRPAPGEVGEDPDESHILDEAVNAVNAAAERAETAESNAEQYAADAKSDREAVEKLKSEFDTAAESVLRTATDARNEAESWAHGHVGYPDRDKDNAMYYSEAAKQVATKNGYCRMEINENGHLILERTENIKDSLDFRLNEKGHLEVMME